MTNKSKHTVHQDTVQDDVQDTAQNLFDQAFKAYEQTLNTGIKIQEETVNLWKNVLCDSPTPTEMQKRLTAIISDGFPAAKKRMAESLRSIEEQYNVSSDLMQKAVQFGQPGSVAESQARIRDIWESSLTAVRNNAQSIVKTNQQILDFWTGVLTTGVKKAAAK